MIKNLRHVGLVVSDMDRAIKFYQGLGFKVISRGIETWSNRLIEVCKMTHGLELIKGKWFHHVAFSVDEIPESMSFVYNKLGVRFTTDPDGNVIELVKEDEL